MKTGVKCLSAIIGVTVFVVIVAINAQAQPHDVVWVDDDAAPGWYDSAHVRTIQEGIYNVSEGGTVYVWNGTYYESVWINETVTVIGNCSIDAIAGEGDNPTQLYYPGEFGFIINGRHVNISGFYITPDGGESVGIYINDSDNCNISRNILDSNDDVGIGLENSSYNTVYNNWIGGSVDGAGIFLVNSSYNEIHRNNITENEWGIYIAGNWSWVVASHNTISNNNIFYNLVGIWLFGTDNETIIENTIMYNLGAGILALLCDDITVSYNNISKNDYSGIFSDYLRRSKILHNNITENQVGIYLEYGYDVAIENNLVMDNHGEETLSCPFIYSWNGNDYIFESDMLTSSILKVLESQDYSRLDYLQSSNGKYVIKISEELDEVGYINEVKLYIVNHSNEVKIIPDENGSIHTIPNLQPPVNALEKDGTDCLHKLIHDDGIHWQSNFSNKNFSNLNDWYDGIVLTFVKPEDADSAKIVMKYKKSELADYMFITKYKLMGEEADEWLEDLNTNATRLQRFLMYYNKVLPNVRIWNGTEWIDTGYFPSPGPWIEREMIKVINISDISGNMLTIWIGASTGSLIIDSIGIDYSQDIPVEIYEKWPETAIKQGLDVLPAIMGIDDEYLELSKGEYAEIVFNSTDNEHNYSYVIKIGGYYTPLINARGKQRDDVDIVRQLLIMIFYNRQFSGHTGIYLDSSSNNRIRCNMIINNTGGRTGLRLDGDSIDNEIFGNCFIDNSPQAWDDGGNNNWNYNFWSDSPTEGEVYSIGGGAESNDFHTMGECCPCRGPLEPVSALTSIGVILLIGLVTLLAVIVIRKKQR